MKNKRAVSEIVMTIILIALVVSVSAVVITLTRDTVKEKIDESTSCGINNFGKIEIDKAKLCYVFGGISDYKLVFAISRQDIKIDSLLISVIGENEAKTFKLNSKI